MHRPWRTCDLRIHRGLFCVSSADDKQETEKHMNATVEASFWAPSPGKTHNQCGAVGNTLTFFDTRVIEVLAHRRPASMVKGRRGLLAVPFERRFGAVSGSLSLFGHALPLVPRCLLASCGRCRP
jgi:hypothetical protein